MSQFTNIPLPTGAVFADTWEGDHRVVMGSSRAITGTDVTVYTTATQSVDGRVEDRPWPPLVRIDGDVDLNSDQCRELAAVLLEVASEMDGWTQSDVVGATTQQIQAKTLELVEELLRRGFSVSALCKEIGVSQDELFMLLGRP